MKKKLHVGTLNVSPAYQRTQRAQLIRSIVRSFDPLAFGSLLVGERNDRSLWVIDGQQRLAAVVQLGHSHVSADVIQSKGSAHEAALFRIVNGNRQKVSRNDLFKAALEAGDSQSIEIVAAAERSGFLLLLKGGSNNKPNEIRQALPLERLYDSGGVHLIERTLRCIAAAWPTTEGATSSFVLTGLGRFFCHHNDADDRRVVRILSSLSPHQLLRHADDARQLLGGARDAVVCKVVAAQYNKRLRTQSQLRLETQ